MTFAAITEDDVGTGRWDLSDICTHGEVTTVRAECTAEDLRFARLAIRVHCGILWPNGERCLSDGTKFPCEIHTWGRATLLAHGWTCEEIDALDTRSGPWS